MAELDKPTMTPVDAGNSNDKPTEERLPALVGGATKINPTAALMPGNSGHKDTTPLYTANNFEELIPELERHAAQYKPLSEEELKKLRRRQRTEGIISSISDAAQSIANLMATHNYAPNMYDATKGMSARAKERFEKDKAQREADADKYFNYAMTIGRLKDAHEQKVYQRHRDDVADQYRAAAEERAQAKADRDEAMAELKYELMQGKISEQQAAARKKGIEADYAARLQQSQINKNNRTPAGRSSKKYYGSLPDENGNMIEYYSRADYEAALNAPWRDISPDREQTTTTEKDDGFFKKTTTTTRQKAKTTGEKAGEARSQSATNRHVGW